MIGVFLLAGSDTQSFANPGLTSCRVCGDKVAKEAEACPHCGAPKPYEGETKTTWWQNGQKRQEVHYKNGKMVLCEKPLALDATEAREMAAACLANGVQLMDGVMWVHHPRAADMHVPISDGALGDSIGPKQP